MLCGGFGLKLPTQLQKMCVQIYESPKAMNKCDRFALDLQ